MRMKNKQKDNVLLQKTKDDCWWRLQLASQQVGNIAHSEGGAFTFDITNTALGTDQLLRNTTTNI